MAEKTNRAASDSNRLDAGDGRGLYSQMENLSSGVYREPSYKE
jgi:hypothetical protein